MRKKKKGSALVYVILLLAVLFTVCVGVMEIGIQSLKQSGNYYGKNSAFFYADSTFEKFIFYIDSAAEDARKLANGYCFLESGAPNLSNQDIKDFYESYLRELKIINEDKTKSKDEKDIKSKEALKIFEEQLKSIFIKQYKGYVNDFFNNSRSLKVKNVKINDDKEGYTWEALRNEIINKPNDVDINIETYNEAQSNGESGYFYNFINNTDKNKFEDFNTEIVSYPKQTLYIRVHMNKLGITRYLIATFKLNPFGQEIEQVEGNHDGSIKVGYNKILDYALISGRNLIAVNGDNKFAIKGDVYVNGTSNDIVERKTTDNFGGIIAGMDNQSIVNLQNASVNPINEAEIIPEKNGNIDILDNAYVGNIQNNQDNFSGGFVKTIGNTSQINVGGNLYCHSIVTDNSDVNTNIQDKTINTPNINISGDSYIADNVTLNQTNSWIIIGGSLIGFETADSDTNYNQSPSIVVNDTNTRLDIGKNVILRGVAFVDGLCELDQKGNYKVDDETRNKKIIFKSVETSAIFPNYLAYSYPIIESDVKDILGDKSSSDEDKLKDRFGEFKSSYAFENSDTRLDIFNILKKDTGKVGFEEGQKFILDYITLSILKPQIYDSKYNLGYNEELKRPIISAPNMKFNNDNPNDTSYFTALFTANNKIYVKNLKKENLNDELDKKLLTKTIEILGEAQSNTGSGQYYYVDIVESLWEKLSTQVLPNIRNVFLNKIRFRDKGNTESNTIDDYLNWNSISSGKDILIKDATKKILISISNNDITINNFENYNGWNVLMVSNGNIFINSNTSNDTKVTGNIIAKGDVVVSGGNITLNYSNDVSRSLMNYNDSVYKTQCKNLHDFFEKGIVDKDIKITNSFKRIIKTNIQILSRRQIAK